MTNARPADAGHTPGFARVLAACLGGAAVQAASRAWIAWLVLDWLAWVFALRIPIRLIALEYGIAYTLLVAALSSATSAPHWPSAAASPSSSSGRSVAPPWGQRATAPPKRTRGLRLRARSAVRWRRSPRSRSTRSAVTRRCS
jgi:hypothetical protein